MASLSEVVAHNIVRLLKADDRTPAWLARRTGKTGDWVRRRLFGGVAITVDDAEVFARALGTTSVALQRELAEDVQK